MCCECSIFAIQGRGGEGRGGEGRGGEGEGEGEGEGRGLIRSIATIIIE